MARQKSWGRKVIVPTRSLRVPSAPVGHVVRGEKLMQEVRSRFIRLLTIVVLEALIAQHVLN